MGAPIISIGPASGWLGGDGGAPRAAVWLESEAWTAVEVVGMRMG
jgi:hypothetical protein